MSDHDAVVIGAGPNGLVAANILADQGWDVVVLEANAQPGGAVRTAEVTAPGFRNDLFSAFYPMTAASPVIAGLRLDRHGLAWTHAPAVLAHPRRDAAAVVLSRDLDATIASLDGDRPGDGDAYRRVATRWARVQEPLMHSLLDPFPPIASAARLAWTARLDGLRELGRMALLPVRRFVQEEFGGEGAHLLFAGNALHADLTLDAAGSALFGWMLVGLGQQHGFPVPVGGAEQIVAALVERLRGRGGRVVCGVQVDRVTIRAGRAVGVETAGGDRIGAGRAVLADCDATALYLSLIGAGHLSDTVLARVRRMQRASATFKIDWALDGPIPWTDPRVAGAGTVHVADSLDELTISSAQLAMGRIPEQPFLLVGQMTTADPTRSPPGTESAWAYTHVPQHVRADAGGDDLSGRWDAAEVETFARRMEQRIEALAPGFTRRVVGRYVQSPPALEAANQNLVRGDISGGTAQLHQQAIFRPISGLARPETPIRRLYLASASAHPGGAVHGAPGANAARAALLHDRLCHPWRAVASSLRSSARRTGEGGRPQIANVAE